MEKTKNAEMVNSQSTKATFSWYLTAFQREGNLWLEWSTDAPFRAQKDKIEVYSGGWPSNPDSDSRKWTWADPDNSPWNSGLPWGSDWYCARIAQSAPDGPYVYVQQIITKADE